MTKLNIDCIVNVASKNLEGGGGLDAAIHKASGPELLDACKKFLIDNETNNRGETGECKIIPGFNLPAKHILLVPKIKMLLNQKLAMKIV